MVRPSPRRSAPAARSAVAVPVSLLGLPPAVTAAAAAPEAVAHGDRDPSARSSAPAKSTKMARAQQALPRCGAPPPSPVATPPPPPAVAVREAELCRDGGVVEIPPLGVTDGDGAVEEEARCRSVRTVRIT
mmetsp:Transcript_112180/g.324089  ORF Transcript_112180/g.324089 Transcript_112180/m.324089 type:complete len:131 (+) Transcript_112180:152-544(+)